jgi:hypothetical protein
MFFSSYFYMFDSFEQLWSLNTSSHRMAKFAEFFYGSSHFTAVAKYRLFFGNYVLFQRCCIFYEQKPLVIDIKLLLVNIRIRTDQYKITVSFNV